MLKSRFIFTVKGPKGIPPEIALVLLRNAGLDVRLATFAGCYECEHLFTVDAEVCDEQHSEVTKTSHQINAVLKGSGFSTVRVCRALEKPLFNLASWLKSSISKMQEQTARYSELLDMIPDQK
jgi:hypothetical protein